MLPPQELVQTAVPLKVGDDLGGERVLAVKGPHRHGMGQGEGDNGDEREDRDQPEESPDDVA